MTQHVRTSYRNHTRTTWGFAIALVVAIAAVLVPIAGGAGGGGKTYTLGVSPGAMCASSTDGAISTVVTLTNTASSQTLGSAEIYFPAGSIHTVSQGTVRQGAGAYPGSWDIIGNLNSLGLGNGQSLNITVTLKAGAHTGDVRAVVKQANQFNDAGGGANLFANPSTWPQLSVAQCQYSFSQGQPVDTQTGTAQTVRSSY